MQGTNPFFQIPKFIQLSSTCEKAHGSDTSSKFAMSALSAMFETHEPPNNNVAPSQHVHVVSMYLSQASSTEAQCVSNMTCHKQFFAGLVTALST